MNVKAAEETDVDWGQLKKVTGEGEEAAEVVEEAAQLKTVEQESEPAQLGPRRQSVLVRANLRKKSKCILVHFRGIYQTLLGNFTCCF